MTRCLAAVCGATVEEPENALGWTFLELISGSGAGWFCDDCSAARLARPTPDEIRRYERDYAALRHTYGDNCSRCYGLCVEQSTDSQGGRDG